MPVRSLSHSVRGGTGNLPAPHIRGSSSFHSASFRRQRSMSRPDAVGYSSGEKHRLKHSCRAEIPASARPRISAPLRQKERTGSKKLKPAFLQQISADRFPTAIPVHEQDDRTFMDRIKQSCGMSIMSSCSSRLSIFSYGKEKRRTHGNARCSFHHLYKTKHT